MVVPRMVRTARTERVPSFGTIEMSLIERIKGQLKGWFR